MTKPQVLGLPPGYAGWLTQLKGRIAQARQRATLAANAELVSLYGQIGREILNRQAEQGWGAKVINRLAHDLKEAFPDMRGFSTRNLKYMAYFAEHCPAGLIGQQPAAQLPWFHVVILLTKLMLHCALQPLHALLCLLHISRNPSYAADTPEVGRLGVTAIKLRKKPPLLLERVGVRRIKNKAKNFI
ncbi:DUF1016 N-terminal domain-containing protein [Methylobacter sp. Wu8]|uniref:DUF1016 N-terminal domain-containing protein n=1 Tax=Methylobacter sp. Wu8 TaxID=3118457 RepID=UPI002F32ADDD